MSRGLTNVSFEKKCVGNSRPETSYPRSLLSGLGKETSIDSNGQKLSIEYLYDEMLVKGKPVESLVLEVVTVSVFGEFTIPAPLKEIDLAWDCHEEF